MEGNDTKQGMVGKIVNISNKLDVGVEWDRIIENELNIIVYGWIHRVGKDRDFIVVDINKETLDYIIITSSVKCSKALNKVDGQGKSCVLFSEYFKNQDIEKVMLDKSNHPCGNCAGRGHPLGEYCDGCGKKEARRNFECCR